MNEKKIEVKFAFAFILGRTKHQITFQFSRGFSNFFGTWVLGVCTSPWTLIISRKALSFQKNSTIMTKMIYD